MLHVAVSLLSGTVFPARCLSTTAVSAWAQGGGNFPLMSLCVYPAPAYVVCGDITISGARPFQTGTTLQMHGYSVTVLRVQKGARGGDVVISVCGVTPLHWCTFSCFSPCRLGEFLRGGMGGAPPKLQAVVL